MKITSILSFGLLGALTLGFVSCNHASSDENATGNQTISEITTGGENYELELVVDGLDIPWGLEFIDGKYLISEKNGKLLLVDQENNRQEIQGMPEIWQQGQGGFLDLTLDPNYEEEPWIYMTYSSEGSETGKGTTTVSRAQLKGNQLENLSVLYRGQEDSDKGFHFGSRVVFDDEGYLYFSIGDRGNRDENPQSIYRDGGKIYRIHKDGSIPEDNPFVEVDGARSAIWSYGHRNPQGMVYHPALDAIWVHEHGPQGGDEINQSEKGKNFGWPIISYGINYDGSSFTEITEKEGMEQPLYYWLPSIAPSGMAYIHQSNYPELEGSLFAGSLKFQYLERLVLDGNKVTKRERWFSDVGRVREVIQAPDGNIYLSVESKGIYKMVPKA